jgi:hypothetical protein
MRRNVFLLEDLRVKRTQDWAFIHDMTKASGGSERTGG